MATGIVNRLLSLIFGSMICVNSLAQPLLVQVLDMQAKAVADAVVYAVPLDKNASHNAAAAQSPTAKNTAIMDQQNKVFVPHVLAVSVGTKVSFPNTDTVNHYVYSFSDTKKFQFKLFKTDPSLHDIIFEKAGLVTLGCNIHDPMLGYIFIAPTDFVGVTNNAGQVQLDLPDHAEYAVMIWHEYSNEKLEKLTQNIATPHKDSPIQIRFLNELKSPRKFSSIDDSY